MLTAMTASAQFRFHHTTEYRDGEMIVKMKEGETMKVKHRGGGRRLVTTHSAVNQVLAVIGATDMTQLMPLSGERQSNVKRRDQYGNTVEDQDLSQMYLVTFADNTDMDVAVAAMSVLDEVEFAEPNYLVYSQEASGWGANDPMYSTLWHLSAVRMPEVWHASSAADGASQRPVIAILDTGVDITHPDLADNIWTNPNEKADGIDDDGNGFKDDLHGWDFINQTGRLGDYNGHGTHCAGIAAAVGDNGVGVVGANPDALIMPITILQSNGTGDVATIVRGIDYAVANGANVLSMSFGSYQYSMAEDLALGKACSRSFLVAAAGNDGHTLEASGHCMDCILNGGMPMYPAALTYVMGVQATMQGGVRAPFSNWDNNGPIMSTYSDMRLYNYEVYAPGVGICSTYPGGRYRELSGTSMACPLVAGIVSRILQTKDVLSYEQLFGDIIHTGNKGLIDAMALYDLDDNDRHPTLSLVGVTLTDSLGDRDGRVDAGEIIDIYPTFRNEWGQADSIVLSIGFGENEDTTICQFITDEQPLGISLSSYAKAKTLHPLRVKMRDDIADGRIVRLVVRATCRNMVGVAVQEFTFKVENGVELGGTQREDITLYPGIQYIVTRNWGIPKDRVVRVKPGTTIKIKDGVGISNYGYILFEGTADSMITITKGDNDLGNIGNFMNDNANYVDFNYVVFDYLSNIDFKGHRYNNCVIRNCRFSNGPLTQNATFRGCAIYNNEVTNIVTGVLSNASAFIETSIYDNYFRVGFGSAARFYHSNFIGNEIGGTSSPDVRQLEYSNCYGNYYTQLGDYYSLLFYTTEPELFYLSQAFIGTANKDVALRSIIDSEDNYGWGTVDVWQMLPEADDRAPVCVSYVKVDGLNPLDDADMLPPLGVGTHTVEVGFNRAMDQSQPPMISMGVRPPYTQKQMVDDGYWFDPWTYRATFTIDGRSATDGTNRIRVYGYNQKGQNTEFGAPDEHYRYNVLVSAAGSLSTGLMADAGLGKVRLTWETDTDDFDDLMGYNVYRYEIDVKGNSTDSLILNLSPIESEQTEFVDYDVVAGQTYYYMVKEIGTDLVEHSVSNAVAATPLTAEKGDANGSMSVDVADVMTIVAWLANEKPQPFIFDAADVNNDSRVDILDVVGTLRLITSPENEMAGADYDAVAYCHVEDRLLYVDSSVALGGIQLRLKGKGQGITTTHDALNGLEQMVAQVGTDEHIFLAYSMSGAVISAARCPVATIDEDTEIEQIVLCTPRGRNVRVMLNSDASVIDDMTRTDNVPPASGMYDLRGHGLQSEPQRGIYIIDGKKVLKK